MAPSESSDHAEIGEDRMDEDPQPKDPNDLSQYNLDEYDEDGGGVGMYSSYTPFYVFQALSKLVVPSVISRG